MAIEHPPNLADVTVDQPMTWTGGGDLDEVLVALAPVLAYVTDTELQLRTLSPTLEELCGASKDELIDAHTLLERLYPDPSYRAVVETIHHGWERNEHIRNVDLVVADSDGEHHTICWSTGRTRGPDGATNGYIAVGLDQTRVRNLEHWVGLFQASAQYLSEGLCLTDPQGHVLMWTGSAQQLLGRNEEDLQGRPLVDLVPEAERKIVSRAIEDGLKDSTSYEQELELLHEDGSSINLGIRVYRLDGPDGPMARIVILAPPDPIPRFQEAIDTVQERATRYRQELEDAKNRVEAEQVRAEESRSDAAACREKEEEAQKEVQAATKLAKTARSETTLATQQAAAAEAKATEALEQADAARTDAREAAGRAEEAEAKAKEAVGQAETAESQAKKAIGRAETAESQAKEAEARAEAAEAETEKLASRTETAEAESKTTAERIEALQGERQEALARAEEAERGAKEAQEAAATAEKRAEAAEAQSAETGAKFETAQIAANEAVRQAEEAAVVAKSAESSAREVSERAAQSEKSAQEEGEARSAALQKLEDRATTAEFRLTEAAEELAQSQERAQRAEAELEELHAQARKAIESSEELEQQIRSAETTLSGLEDDANSVRDHLEAEKEHGELLKGEMEEARRREKEADQRAGLAENRVLELESHIQVLEDSRNASAADLAVAAKETERARTEAQQASSEREQDVEEWIHKKQRMEREHREALEDAHRRAAEDRKILEDQLRRDILAAEERAEEEQKRIQDEHHSERKQWEHFADIARGEARTELRDDLARLERRLDSQQNTQAHLPAIRELAFVAADTRGRVVGWSGGCSSLDGRDEIKAVGATLHKDVLCLEGVNWKNLFARVVISGKVDGLYTLVRADGTRRQVQLTATAIKDARGKPVGLTEVLQVPQLEGSLEQIALAAFGRLCVPFHGPLSAQVKTNLNLQRDAIAAIQDLGSLGAVVRDGGTGGDLEAAARRINLDELLAVCEALITRSRTASQELQASASDLRTLSSGMKSTSPFVLRWNELVDRCLHALRFHRETPPEVNCSYGDSGRVTAAGSVVVPLVLSLLEGALASGDRVTITTSASDSEVHLSVEPGLRAGPALSRVRLLAMEAGGDLDGDGGDATKTTLRLPSLDPHANPYESTTQRGRLSFQSESTTGPQPRGGENQPSDSGDTAEMANEKGAVRNIDDLDETQSELPALGKNNSVVEVVGQMTPGLTRKWGGDMGPDEPGEAGPTAEAKAKASEKSKAKPKAKAKEGKKKRSRKARAKKGVKSE